MVLRQSTQVVRCVKGALWDAILDLRPGSATFGQSFGAELSADNRRMMYVPRGFAHGFLTLEEDTEAFYLVTTFYAPQCERGVRWNDPRFAINWPARAILIGECKWGTDAVDRQRVRDLLERTIPLTGADLPNQGAGWQITPALFARAGATPAARATLEAAGGVLVDLPTLFADLAEA